MTREKTIKKLKALAENWDSNLFLFVNGVGTVTLWRNHPLANGVLLETFPGIKADSGDISVLEERCIDEE